MAGASDKARYFLERSVPELQEYERKGIFTREEITGIASRRSDFEHTINARGCRAGDFAKYASYEMNVDALRRKRSRRAGVRAAAPAFAGPRNVFFILDRATRRFPGDLALWMQYVQFCRREKAHKKLARVLTSVLRLRPRDTGLWVLAAKHAAEDLGDMSTARAYMQRGLRFCKSDPKLWLEYMRLEMAYLAKLAARKKILGLDENERTPTGPEQSGGLDDDMLMLPTVTAEDLDEDATKGLEQIDLAALQKLASTPAFTGSIPKAIFDAAMKQFDDRPNTGEDFFDVAASFDRTPSSSAILQHILRHLRATAPSSVEVLVCDAKLRLWDIDHRSADFPAALGSALAVLNEGQSGVTDKLRPALAQGAVLLLLSSLSKSSEDLDEDVVTAIRASIRRYLKLMSPPARSSLFARLQKDGRNGDADVLEALEPPA